MLHFLAPFASRFKVCIFRTFWYSESAEGSAKVPRPDRNHGISMDFADFAPPQTGEAKNIEPDLRAETPYRNSVRQHPGAMYKDDKNKIWSLQRPSGTLQLPATIPRPSEFFFQLI